jgi:hypothetical protein
VFSCLSQHFVYCDGMVTGQLIGLSPASLQSIITACEQGIVAGMVRGINYSIAGRNFGFASMEELRQTMAEAQYALGLTTGQRSAFIRANFNPALGRQGGGLGLSTAPPYSGGDGNPF